MGDEELALGHLSDLDLDSSDEEDEDDGGERGGLLGRERLAHKWRFDWGSGFKQLGAWSLERLD